MYGEAIQCDYAGDLVRRQSHTLCRSLADGPSAEQGFRLQVSLYNGSRSRFVVTHKLRLGAPVIGK